MTSGLAHARRSSCYAGPVSLMERFPPKLTSRRTLPSKFFPRVTVPARFKGGGLTTNRARVTQVWFDLEKRLVELIYPDRPLR